VAVKKEKNRLTKIFKRFDKLMKSGRLTKVAARLKGNKMKKDVYKTAGAARKRARSLGLRGIHSHGRGKSKVFMPGSTHKAYNRAMRRKKK
tara:strand:+ start:148 stop:420 length:273 start_codon:yes stop_codon:yes gene_type:complete